MFFCEIIYGVRVSSLGQACWVTAVPLHQAFIAHTEIKHHCVQCLVKISVMKLVITKMEK